MPKFIKIRISEEHRMLDDNPIAILSENMKRVSAAAKRLNKPIEQTDEEIRLKVVEKWHEKATIHLQNSMILPLRRYISHEEYDRIEMVTRDLLAKCRDDLNDIAKIPRRPVE